MNKKVLITGASRGIGKAIAEQFAEAGFDIYMTCKKNIDLLRSFAETLMNTYPITCHAICCDMGNASDVETLFAQIDDLDVVVNNAGIAYIGLLTDMSLEEWQEVMNTNLNAAFFVCRKAIPLMLHKKEGKIINISSVWGNVGASMEVAYSTTKGGINAFTKALAKELGPSNIQVNAIACGVIDTQMNQCFSEEERAALSAEIPADRFGSAKEVAELALDLAQKHSYLTGQIITLDGGWT